MAIAIDGTAHNSGSGSTLSVTLTTTGAGLVCIALTANEAPITSVNSASLTFTQHVSQNTGNADRVIELWTAPSTGSISESITVTQSASGFITVDGFGISDADTTTIFDGNASIPDTGTGDPRTVSTDETNTMVLGLFRMTSTASPTAGSGYTTLSGADYQLVEYQVFSTTQTSLSVDITTGTGNANAGIGTAIIESAGGTSAVPIIQQLIQ